MTLNRTQRDLLKRAHKTPLTEDDLGEDLVLAVELVGLGLLTGTPRGFVITTEGCRSIGKRPTRDATALAKMTAANLDALVPEAIAMIQENAPKTETATEEVERTTALLLTMAVAIGILSRILSLPADEVMAAIAVGRRVKLTEGPVSEGGPS